MKPYLQQSLAIAPDSSDRVIAMSATESIPARRLSAVRLDLELALDAASAGRRLTAEALREAAGSAGADVVFALPGSDGTGVVAVLRLHDEGRAVLLRVASTVRGYSIADETEMEPHLLDLARASIDVLERMGGDRAIREPLAAR
jgi:hypothetical protein